MGEKTFQMAEEREHAIIGNGLAGYPVIEFAKRVTWANKKASVKRIVFQRLSIALRLRLSYPYHKSTYLPKLSQPPC